MVCFRAWKFEFGKLYKYSYNWEDAVDECEDEVEGGGGDDEDPCIADPTPVECRPAEQVAWSYFLDGLSELNIITLFGPDHANQVTSICTKFGNPSDVCTYFTNVDVSYPNGRAEISVKLLDHLVQIAFAGKFVEYNDSWATNGWYTDMPEYDVNAINAVNNNHFIDADPVCDEIVNKAVLDTQTTKNLSVHW